MVAIQTVNISKIPLPPSLSPKRIIQLADVGTRKVLLNFSPVVPLTPCKDARELTSPHLLLIYSFMLEIFSLYYTFHALRRAGR